MKNRILALSCMCLLVLNLAASAVVPAGAAHSGHLVQLLPAVDGVAVIDSKRFFSAALPKLLSANPTLLGKVTTGIEEMKTSTGVDITRFEHLVVGANARNKGAKEYDFELIVVARGPVSSAALIGAAKLAANGKYREEQVGDRTIYLFSPKAAIASAQKQAPASVDPATADKLASKAPKEIAVTSLDDNTLAFGDLALVRQAVSPRKTAVAVDLTSLLSKNEASVVSFAGRMPGGLGALLPLENDELGKNIESIRYVYGGADMAGDAAVLNVTARTTQNQQATSLYETLEGLRMLGKALLGGSKGGDKQVFARMIENAKFSSTGNEVSLSLQVPQSDIDVLVAGIK